MMSTKVRLRDVLAGQRHCYMAQVDSLIGATFHAELREVTDDFLDVQMNILNTPISIDGVRLCHTRSSLTTVNEETWIIWA